MKENICTKQRYNGKGCNVKLTLFPWLSTVILWVVNLVGVHNHTSPDLFMWYPQNRALSKGDKLDRFVLLNAKPKDIKEAIPGETGLCATSQDLRNRRHKCTSTHKMEDSQKHRSLLEHLKGIDGWTAPIQKNEGDDLFLLLQSRHERAHRTTLR